MMANIDSPSGNSFGTENMTLLKENNSVTDVTVSSSKNSIKGIYFAGVAGVSLVSGFSFALMLAKKKDETYFNKGLVGATELPGSGGALAMRALGRATLFSLTGFGVLCLGAWKLLGVRNMQELRERIQSRMPGIPKHEPQGRSEFGSLRELVEYITEDDGQNKKS